MLNPGNYSGIATGPKLYETEKGALMFGCLITVTSPPDYVNETITCRQCIVAKDGTISEITTKMLREVFDWMTEDPFWIVDNCEETPLDFTVEHEDYDGKTRDRVRWMNRPGEGGGGGLGNVKEADRKDVLRKYGSRFRAMAGGKAVSAPKKTAPPPAKKSAPPPPSKKAEATASNEDDCWAAFNKANEGKDDGTIADLWFKFVEAKYPGVPFTEITPSQWGDVMSAIDDNVPY